MKTNLTNLLRKVDFGWSILATAASISNPESVKLYLIHATKKLSDCRVLMKRAEVGYIKARDEELAVDPAASRKAMIYLQRVQALESETLAFERAIQHLSNVMGVELE